MKLKLNTEEYSSKLNISKDKLYKLIKDENFGKGLFYYKKDNSGKWEFVVDPFYEKIGVKKNSLKEAKNLVKNLEEVAKETIDKVIDIQKEYLSKREVISFSKIKKDSLKDYLDENFPVLKEAKEVKTICLKKIREYVERRRFTAKVLKNLSDLKINDIIFSSTDSIYIEVNTEDPRDKVLFIQALNSLNFSITNFNILNKKELVIRISDHNVNRTKARIKEINGEEIITIRKKDQSKMSADIFLFYPDSYLNNVKYILEK